MKCPDMDTGELWKDIKGFEGAYQISNYGRVRSLRRTMMWGRNLKTLRVLEEVIMAQQLLIGSHNTEYFAVWLRKPKVHKKMFIHRLVAEAFVPNLDPETMTIVNHRDSDKGNNHATNLEWITQSDNVRHYFRRKNITETMNDAF